MPSETIATVAHDVVAINRSTAHKIIKTQCKGLNRLIDAPISAYQNMRRSLNLGTPLCQVADNMGDIGRNVGDQSEQMLDDYGDMARKFVDWMSDRADWGINKLDDNLLSRGAPVVDRVFVPGAELLRRLSEQASSFADQAVDLVTAKKKHEAAIESDEAEPKKAHREVHPRLADSTVEASSVEENAPKKPHRAAGRPRRA